MTESPKGLGTGSNRPPWKWSEERAKVHASGICDSSLRRTETLRALLPPHPEILLLSLHTARAGSCVLGDGTAENLILGAPTADEGGRATLKIAEQSQRMAMTSEDPSITFAFLTPRTLTAKYLLSRLETRRIILEESD